ncbi:hypothetical protein L211DRAFT_488996 [Terfezia boudieri ATCC MYA-4762]|uniref:Uncharacterized protein n=1 Tax=Terfezia boudieri ATCC MYA-4762 TaxID=1051890 RepID=A0A3N4LJS4_9PEZI|nr:hypothetical protein L211DRAFT_488996 [Terfezia boudieri ATCC MYA-4762]
MPPLNSKNSQRASTRRMVDVTEKVLRGVYEPTFKSCSWATAGEIYQALKATGFDEQRAIDKLNSDRPKQPTNNAATEILGRFGLEPDPEDGAEERPETHTMDVHDHPKQRIASASKRASPIPDPRAEYQMSKRPRRNAPQKPMANNSRATPIVIQDEEDEISDSSQQLPPPPQEPLLASTNGVGSPPHLPSSLDSITDPMEPWIMDVDSAHPTPSKKSVLFTNDSSPAKINPGSRALRSPRPMQTTQASIRNYILPVSPQRRAVDPAQIASTVQGLPSRSNHDVWRSRGRPPTPGPPNHLFPECNTPSSENTSAPASATITTVSSDSDEGDEKERQSLPQTDFSNLAPQRKKVGYEVFNDDSYHGPIYSSPFPHKKIGQGNFKAETLPKHSTSPALLSSLKQEEVWGRKASPGITEGKEEILQVNLDKPNLSGVPTLPAPPLSLSQIKGKEKRPTIEVLIERTAQGVDGPSKLKAEVRGGRAPREFRDEIPSSQPSPPAVSRHTTPNPELEEFQGVIEVHGGMRETRYKRAMGQAMNARQASSELSELPFIPSSPDRPKKKQDVELVDDDDEEEEDDDNDEAEEESIEELSPPPAMKKISSSKPKRSAPRGRGVAVARKKEKTPGNEKKAGTSKWWVTVAQDEEGGERDEEVKQGGPVMMTRERKRRVGRG